MSETPNRAMIEGWNNAIGKTWTRFQKQLDIQLAPIGARVIEAARVAPGDHVLDVGCGSGALTVALADQAGRTGRAIGADISALLLAVARDRPTDPDAAPLDWICADVQTHAFEPDAIDVVASRFGVMFFDDPVAAFANLYRATKPGGRLAFACWRSVEDNPWLTLPVEAAAHLVPPPAPAPPGAPGPFAFADAARVRDILGRAGWSKVGLDPCDAAIGGLPQGEMAALMTRIGPLGAAIREAGAAKPLLAAAEAAVRTALEPFVTAAGVFTPSASWIVTAKA